MVIVFFSILPEIKNKNMNIRNYVLFFASKLWLCISGPSLYGVQLAVYVSFLFEVANILKYPKIYIIQYMNIFFFHFLPPSHSCVLVGWAGMVSN